MSLRQRYSLALSVLYILLGTIIAVRAVMAPVIPVVLLGLVFIALGIVRIRDYVAWRGRR